MTCFLGNREPKSLVSSTHWGPCPTRPPLQPTSGWAGITPEWRTEAIRSSPENVGNAVPGAGKEPLYLQLQGIDLLLLAHVPLALVLDQLPVRLAGHQAVDVIIWRGRRSNKLLTAVCKGLFGWSCIRGVWGGAFGGQQHSSSPIKLWGGRRGQSDHVSPTSPNTRHQGWAAERGTTSSVVPDSVIGQLHGVGVLGLLEVLVGVSAHVAPAADVPTDEAYPEILQNRKREGRKAEATGQASKGAPWFTGPSAATSATLKGGTPCHWGSSPLLNARSHLKTVLFSKKNLVCLLPNFHCTPLAGLTFALISRLYFSFRGAPHPALFSERKHASSGGLVLLEKRAGSGHSSSSCSPLSEAAEESVQQLLGKFSAGRRDKAGDRSHHRQAKVRLCPTHFLDATLKALVLLHGLRGLAVPAHGTPEKSRAETGVTGQARNSTTLARMNPGNSYMSEGGGSAATLLCSCLVLLSTCPAGSSCRTCFCLQKHLNQPEL